ncbi:MAG: hypothetical protein KF857_12830 [Fimbriimonadaceae bacterium]|nr:hypothetical protein [Fimbriimonadaceae bacterium]
MSWREGFALGHGVVREIHDTLRIDDQHVLDDVHGFTWWPGDFCQTIKTDEGIFRQSTVTYRVTAETDFLKGRGHMRDLALALEDEMDDCSFSGPVYDQATDTFKLHCSVYLADENVDWLRRTVLAATALQVYDAQLMIDRLVEKLHAVRAVSGHPTAGMREEPHPLLKSAHKFFWQAGMHPSRWIDTEEWREGTWVMEREAVQFESDRSSRLEAEFEWGCGEGNIHVTARTDQPHSYLGNGLHITMTVPLKLSTEAIGHLVLDLNGLERTDYKRCHVLGSWCAHEGRLAFRVFVPNTLYTPQVLPDMLVSVSTRAIWVNEWFFQKKCEAAHAAPPPAPPPE